MILCIDAFGLVASGMLISGVVIIFSVIYVVIYYRNRK